MTHKPSRFIIPTGTDLTTDADVLPAFRGRGFLSKKNPTWKTETQESLSGREYRRRLWTYPRWKFSFSHEVLHNISSPDLSKLFSFYNSHYGSYKEFLYLDDEDHQAVLQPLAVGDGVTSTFQLTRTMSLSTIPFTEPVRALYGNPQVFFNGVPTISFSLGEYGRITFNTPPSNGVTITWSGSFFFVCRFDEDELGVDQIMSGLWGNPELSFTSIKP